MLRGHGRAAAADGRRRSHRRPTRAGITTIATNATPPISIARSPRSRRRRSCRQLFEKLAVVEDRHSERWEELFRASGRPLPAYTTARRTRLLAWVARQFGTSLVLPHDAGRGRARGPGLPRAGAALREPADAQGGGRHRVGLGGARARAVRSDGARRGAVARRRIGRVPAQRRVRLQRRADGELRSGRRRHRRVASRRTS